MSAAVSGMESLFPYPVGQWVGFGLVRTGGGGLIILTRSLWLKCEGRMDQRVLVEGIFKALSASAIRIRHPFASQKYVNKYSDSLLYM